MSGWVIERHQRHREHEWEWRSPSGEWLPSPFEAEVILSRWHMTGPGDDEHWSLTNTEGFRRWQATVLVERGINAWVEHHADLDDWVLKIADDDPAEYYKTIEILDPRQVSCPVCAAPFQKSCIGTGRRQWITSRYQRNVPLIHDERSIKAGFARFLWHAMRPR